MNKQIILVSCFILAIRGIALSQEAESPPQIINDLLSIEGRSAVTSRTAKESIARWDSEILEPSLVPAQSGEEKAASGLNGKPDVIVSKYETPDWSVTTKHAYHVWLAVIAVKNHARDLSREEIIAKVLNLNKAAMKLGKAEGESSNNTTLSLSEGSKKIQEQVRAGKISPEIAAGKIKEIETALANRKVKGDDVQRVVEELRARHLSLERVGDWKIKDNKNDLRVVDVYRIPIAKMYENHWLSHLRIVHIDNQYILWTLTLDGYPRSAVFNYSEASNANWFKDLEASDKRRTD